MTTRRAVLARDLAEKWRWACDRIKGVWNKAASRWKAAGGSSCFSERLQMRCRCWEGLEVKPVI